MLTPALIGAPLKLPGRLAMVLVSLGLAVLTLYLVENPARCAPSLKGSGTEVLRSVLW